MKRSLFVDAYFRRSLGGMVLLLGLVGLATFILERVVSLTIGWPETSAGLVLVLPAVYLGWLFFVILLCNVETRVSSLWYTKPARRVTRENQRLDLAARMVLQHYAQYALIESLPLVQFLKCLPLFRGVVLRCYSTAVHIHHSAETPARILDPDLTWIDEGVIIGENTRILAHMAHIGADRKMVYASAPVRIGNYATIGGDSFVEMGTVIGEGALVESGSHLPPYSRVGPGEVWGGWPARFKRLRDDQEQRASSPDRHGPGASRTLPSAEDDLDGILAVVASALRVSVDRLGTETTSDDLSAWDSLGMMAIHAGLHDRYGVSLSMDQVTALNSIRAVAAALRVVEREEASVECSGESMGDPEWLPLLEPELATAALARGEVCTDSSIPSRAVKVRVAATFTAEMVEPSLESWGRALGIDIDVGFAGFDQVAQALLSPDGLFGETGEGEALNVVLTRCEDLPGPEDPGGMEKANALLGALREYSRVSRVPLLVGDLPPLLDERMVGDGIDFDGLRAHWRKEVESIPGLMLLNCSHFVEELGHARSRPEEAPSSAAIAYSPAVYQRIGIGIARVVRSRVRPAARVLAVDCDDTLWGGVLGEDGFDGIRIGGEGSDCPFRGFQTELKRLRERGVLIVLTSRNEWEDVEAVFRDHPSMVLKLDDVAAQRVNWTEKSVHLKELSEELGLGLDAFVFVDDDPHQRSLVRTVLPEVHVLPLAERPEERSAQVRKLWIFDGSGTTPEDRQRTAMVRAESERGAARENAGGLDSFLAELNLQVRVRPAGADDVPRVVQLVQKTNQFNLNVRRLPCEEVERRVADGTVRVCETWDRFGDYGLTGVLMLGERKDDARVELDMLLMSCRALGRGVEDAFLAAVACELSATGANELDARYEVGPRNGPVREFLTRMGFEARETDPATDGSSWTAELSTMAEKPSHVTMA